MTISEDDSQCYEMRALANDGDGVVDDDDGEEEKEKARGLGDEGAMGHKEEGRYKGSEKEGSEKKNK